MILFCALFSKLMIIGVTPHVKLNRKFMTNVECCASAGLCTANLGKQGRGRIGPRVPSLAFFPTELSLG
jgi:hypothetical protein